MKRFAIILLVLVVAGVGALGWYKYIQANNSIIAAKAAEDARLEAINQAKTFSAGVMVSATDSRLTVGIPTQVQRDGSTFIDIKNDSIRYLSSTTIIDLRQSNNPAKSVFDIPAGSPLRLEIVLDSDPGTPDDRKIETVYVLPQ